MVCSKLSSPIYVTPCMRPLPRPPPVTSNSQCCTSNYFHFPFCTTLFNTMMAANKNMQDKDMSRKQKTQKHAGPKHACLTHACQDSPCKHPLNGKCHSPFSGDYNTIFKIFFCMSALPHLLETCLSSPISLLEVWQNWSPLLIWKQEKNI